VTFGGPQVASFSDDFGRSRFSGCPAVDRFFANSGTTNPSPRLAQLELHTLPQLPRTAALPIIWTRACVDAGRPERWLPDNAT
jgi:hypothetical protein